MLVLQKQKLQTQSQASHIYTSKTSPQCIAVCDHVTNITPPVLFLTEQIRIMKH